MGGPTDVHDATFTAFHGQVTALSGFSRIPADFSRWPTVRVAEALPAAADLEGFEQAVLALRDTL